MQFTIEKSRLTAWPRNPSADDAPASSVVEASDPEAAVLRYVVDGNSELMSHAHPLHGEESVATVRTDETLYMLRIYPN